jgi:hypothetical protein
MLRLYKLNDWWTFQDAHLLNGCTHGLRPLSRNFGVS